MNVKKLLMRSPKWAGWLVIGLTLSLVLLPPEARAAFLSSKAASPTDTSSLNRGQDLDRIQVILESKVIAQRLSDLGLTQSQIMERLGQMSDGQIHQVAGQLDTALMPGAGSSLLVIVLVVILLIILL